MAISTNKESFKTTKANIAVPGSLELLWAYAQQKKNPQSSKILICCFYSPPVEGKNQNLVDHIENTLLDVLSKNPDQPLLILGDINLVEVEALTSIDPSLKQIVTEPTRGRNILDVVITNVSHKYYVPQVIPAILPDTPGDGVPSDHKGVLAHPSTFLQRSQEPPKRIIVQPLPESK